MVCAPDDVFAFVSVVLPDAPTDDAEQFVREVRDQSAQKSLVAVRADPLKGGDDGFRPDTAKPVGCGYVLPSLHVGRRRRLVCCLGTSLHGLTSQSGKRSQGSIERRPKIPEAPSKKSWPGGWSCPLEPFVLLTFHHFSGQSTSRPSERMYFQAIHT